MKPLRRVGARDPLPHASAHVVNRCPGFSFRAVEARSANRAMISAVVVARGGGFRIVRVRGEK